LRGAVVIDDGSAADDEVAGAGYDSALAGQSSERDFGPRSGDDIYLLYTGGSPQDPKGVRWPQQDSWASPAGGIELLTAPPLADEWAQSQKALAGGLVKLCTAPLIHGNAQWAALMGLFAGETIVFVPKFDPAEIWSSVQRYAVNVLVIIGDAMA